MIQRRLSLFLLALFMIGCVLILATSGLASTTLPDIVLEVYCPEGSTDSECVEHATEYVLTGFKQTEANIIFVYHSQGAPFGPQTNALARAVEDWGTATTSGTNTSLAQVSGLPANSLCGGTNGAPLPQGLDGQNTIMWAPLAGQAIGRACWSGADEADIVLDSTWPGFANDEATRTVAAHEVGHALGLGHSLVNAAVMWASYGAPKQLHADDVAGFCAVYGCTTPSSTPSFTPTTPSLPTPTPTRTPTAMPTPIPTPVLYRCGERIWLVPMTCQRVPGIARD